MPLVEEWVVWVYKNIVVVQVNRSHYSAKPLSGFGFFEVFIDLPKNPFPPEGVVVFHLAVPALQTLRIQWFSAGMPEMQQNHMMFSI